MPGSTLVRISSDGFVFETDVLQQAISINKGANFNEQPIQGRSSPVLTFSGSGCFEYTIPMTLMAESKENFNAKDIAEIAMALQSMTFPEESSVEAPSIVYLTLGSGLMVKNFTTVLTNCAVNWGGAVYDENGDPLLLDLSITLKRIELKAQSKEDFNSNFGGSYQQMIYRKGRA